MKRTLAFAVVVAISTLNAFGCKPNAPTTAQNNPPSEGGPNPPSTGNGPAEKLAKDVVGTWARGREIFAFRTDGGYTDIDGGTTLQGKWKATDANTLELSFILSKEQVAALKPLYELAKKNVEAANVLAKQTAETGGVTIKFEPLPMPPEPKEGANVTTLKVARVDAETLTINGTKYTKQIGVWGPFLQTGKFVAEVGGTGEVYFPIPFAEPPVVSVKAFAGLTKLKVTDVTATGFKWQHTDKDKTFGNPEIIFTANGNPTGTDQKPFEQSGTFKVKPKETGTVTFPQPYASPPHVELKVKLGLHKVRVTKTTATGFTWKNDGSDKFFDTHDMDYTVKGVKVK